MGPILCLFGGCNGAGKTTLAMELLPKMGIRRFLNADEIARGLSPFDPSLSAFRAGKLLIEELRALVDARVSFGLESTLSGMGHVALLRSAQSRGYRIVLHYIVIDSSEQAIRRVALRVLNGGHSVPADDVRRRFQRSRRLFVHRYLPLADEWVLWDNAKPPYQRMADSNTHSAQEVRKMLDTPGLGETPPEELPEFVRLGLEAGRIATAKKLDFYRRMGIEVTPEITLAPPPEVEGETSS